MHLVMMKDSKFFRDNNKVILCGYTQSSFSDWKMLRSAQQILSAQKDHLPRVNLGKWSLLYDEILNYTTSEKVIVYRKSLMFLMAKNSAYYLLNTLIADRNQS